jgi:hypothetical protein
MKHKGVIILKNFPKIRISYPSKRRRSDEKNTLWGLKGEGEPLDEEEQRRQEQ